MTIDEHRELLSRVKYKPGWTFELHEEQNGYLSLVVHADVPDSWAPESQTHISMSYTFSKSVFSPNSGSFFQFVRQSVETTGGTNSANGSRWTTFAGRRRTTRYFVTMRRKNLKRKRRS